MIGWLTEQPYDTFSCANMKCAEKKRFEFLELVCPRCDRHRVDTLGLCRLDCDDAI